MNWKSRMITPVMICILIVFLSHHEISAMSATALVALKQAGCSEEDIFEAIAVAALFNFMDRMADALGAPLEGFQEMMAQMAAPSNDGP